MSPVTEQFLAPKAKRILRRLRRDYRDDRFEIMVSRIEAIQLDPVLLRITFENKRTLSFLINQAIREETTVVRLIERWECDQIYAVVDLPQEQIIYAETVLKPLPHPENFFIPQTSRLRQWRNKIDDRIYWLIQSFSLQH